MSLIDPIDYEAWLTANKALSVIFTILISCTALGLLGKIIANRSAAHDVRRCMVITLTLGVLLYSLFPLVVNDVVLFSDIHINAVSCGTWTTSSIYEFYFLPFVYSFGLIVMAFEVFMGRSGNTPSTGIKCVYIICPWLLALVVVLPLTMAGIEWDNGCNVPFTRGQRIAEVLICSLLPPVGAGIAFIVLLCTVKSSRVPTAGGTQGDMNNIPAIGMGHQTVSYTVVQNPLPAQQHPHPYPQQQQQPYYPPPPTNAPPPPGFGPANNANNAPFRNLRSEKNALGLVSIVIFVTSLPFPIYMLAYTLDANAGTYTYLVLTVFGNVARWISVLRWLLLSISWFKFV